MTGEEIRERLSIAGRLRLVVPELMENTTRCGARRPRMSMSGVEYELDDDGEWVAVED